MAQMGSSNMNFIQKNIEYVNMLNSMVKEKKNINTLPGPVSGAGAASKL